MSRRSGAAGPRDRPPATWRSERAALAKVELLSLDVDGVLTDGRLRYGPDGELFKTFHAHDGLGIKLLQREGIRVAVISAKQGAALERRLADLGVTHAWLGREDKRAALDELRERLGVPREAIAHVGDDLPDLAVMRRVRVSIAVADANAKVREEALLVTERRGGHGAVREIAEQLLRARGRLERSVEAYLESADRFGEPMRPGARRVPGVAGRDEAMPEHRRGATGRTWGPSRPRNRGGFKPIGAPGARLSFVVVIPARWASSRLPGKPLANVAGRPLVARCLDRARESSADEVLVAVDDPRIAEAVGDAAVMTRSDHSSGTDRLAEVARRRGWADDTIVVNMQGDEPLLPAPLLDALAAALETHPRAGIATIATPIHEPGDLFRESVVKCALDDEGFALTFSRAPIPWVRGAFAGAPPDALPPGVPFLRHLGMYAYRASTLARLSAAPVAALERAESLEQLRALALGIPIHVTVVAEAPPHGVDTPEDLERVRAILSP